MPASDTPSEESVQLSAATRSQTKYQLSVRQAVELLCQEGDLGNRDRDVASAREGQDAHRKVQQSWGGDMQAEVSLRQSFRRPGFTLTLQGRIDGLQVSPAQVRFVEIKTLRHPATILPPGLKNRHRLQVMLYAALWLANQPQEHLQPQTAIELNLTYVDILADKVEPLREHCTLAELEQLTQPLLDHLQSWYDDLHRHRMQRNELLQAIDFPYLEFRPGQRALAAQVYRTLRQSQQTLIEAPTGSGKSLATLFPGLKAMALNHLDQLVITSAKTASQQAALDAVAQVLGSDKKRLRTLQLSARERICEQDSICNRQDCPRQSNFFARLPDAMDKALLHGWLDAATVSNIALEHEICPHGLQSALQPWVDVLIGDYNYVFSPSVRSEMVFSHNRVGLLIDEAHNLPDRARDLFSARLDSHLLRHCLAGQISPSTALAKSCRTLLKRIQQVTLEDDKINQGLPALHKALEQFCGAAEQWLLTPHDLLSSQATSVAEPPLQDSLDGFEDQKLSAINSGPANQSTASPYKQGNPDQNNQENTREALQQARQWLYLADVAAEDFACFEQLVDASVKARQRTLMLRCLSPAQMLKPMFKAAASAVLFSATLTPPAFYQTLLGLARDIPRHRMASPFRADNQHVLLAPFLNLRSKSRLQQIPEIIRLIAATYRQRPGNYWVYTPSYEFQDLLASQFAGACPDIEVITQPSENSIESRQAFLNCFSVNSRKLGFVVLGGVFGESIDMAGERLIGTIILGPGLPQLSQVNDAISRYFDQQGLDGFAYAYQLPGWQKVIQAAGRVIRTDTDQGVVILADDRFTQAQYRQLFPPHWQAQTAHSIAQTEQQLEQFWQLPTE